MVSRQTGYSRAFTTGSSHGEATASISSSSSRISSEEASADSRKSWNDCWKEDEEAAPASAVDVVGVSASAVEVVGVSMSMDEEAAAASSPEVASISSAVLEVSQFADEESDIFEFVLLVQEATA